MNADEGMAATIAAVLILTFLGARLCLRRLNRHGRHGLLNTLQTLDPARREALLAKFTPKVQAELREALRRSSASRHPTAGDHPLQSPQWFAFQAATKGALIHRLLRLAFVGFLFVGMFGGAFAGYFLAEHFHTRHASDWECGCLVIGMFWAIFGYIPFRFWALGFAFRRHLARTSSPGNTSLP